MTQKTTCELFGGPCDGETVEVEDCANTMKIPVMDEMTAVHGKDFIFYPYGHPKYKVWPSKYMTYTRDTSRTAAFVFCS